MEDNKQRMGEQPEETKGQESEESKQKTDAPLNDDVLEKACRERDDFMDRYQRTFSDFNNYKKRMLSARSEAIKEGQCDAIEKMLPVLDSFERALDHIEDCDEQSAVVQGMKMVYRQLCEALDKLCVKEVPALGEVFDPNLHQAMQMIEPKEGDCSGTVANVLQKGYAMGDRVLRHSMVIVNK